MKFRCHHVQLGLFVVSGFWLSNCKASMASADNTNPGSLVWEPRTEFPGGGRHHPITFANSTHGFVLSGSTLQDFYTSDFWAYEAETETWTDLSGTVAAFPGTARSFVSTRVHITPHLWF